MGQILVGAGRGKCEVGLEPNQAALAMHPGGLNHFLVRGHPLRHNPRALPARRQLFGGPSVPRHARAVRRVGAAGEVR